MTAEKDVQVDRKRGRGGGREFGQFERKHYFFRRCSLRLFRTFPKLHPFRWGMSLLDTVTGRVWRQLFFGANLGHLGIGGQVWSQPLKAICDLEVVAHLGLWSHLGASGQAWRSQRVRILARPEHDRNQDDGGFGLCWFFRSSLSVKYRLQDTFYCPKSSDCTFYSKLR